MTIQKATNITWHEGAVTKQDRERILNQKGVVIWFTGLSGSGKSTLAHAVEEKLFDHGHISYVLNGDNIRHGLNKNLGFSPEDREENIRRIGEVANLFAEAGFIVMTAFISPYRRDRNKARELLKEGRFVEVFDLWKSLLKCLWMSLNKEIPRASTKKQEQGRSKNSQESLPPTKSRLTQS
jgi:adenylylsulfate kinase